MKKNKQILKYCPNFYKIVNFEYLEDDFITHKLISIYEDYIFMCDEEKDKGILEKLDYAVNKYIDDYLFRKEMRNGLTEIRVKKTDNIKQVIVDSIIRLSENYDMGFTRNIYFARWI